MGNPYVNDYEDEERRYEIVENPARVFRYTVFRYHGTRIYPFGTVVNVAMTKSGAHRIIERDKRTEGRRIVETVYG
jgi:hypothetical protein